MIRKSRRNIAILALCVAGFAFGGPAWAGEADVLKVVVKKSGDKYRFSVTLRHADTGDEHYANKWDIVAPDGTVIATRTLYHPHVHEQPFTRSLGGVTIPAGITEVTIRGHDSQHAYGGQEKTVKLP